MIPPRSSCYDPPTNPKPMVRAKKNETLSHEAAGAAAAATDVPDGVGRGGLGRARAAPRHESRKQERPRRLRARAAGPAARERQGGHRSGTARLIMMPTGRLLRRLGSPIPPALHHPGLSG